jgi:hypothetical protein
MTAEGILSQMFGGRRLIIEGAGPSASRTKLLRHRMPDAVLWTLNNHLSRHGSSDAHWEIHRPRHHRCHNVSCPIFIHPESTPWQDNEHPLPDVPENVASTIAWELAYAARIRPQVPEVYLVGCDYLVTGREHELPSLNYWIGLLRGKGIRVELPPDSRLLKHGDNYS